MKIKNLSEQNLNLSFTRQNGNNSIVLIKPNQVVYSEDNKDNNKQLMIYEKKKLIYVNREIDKPEFVDYYKPFYESGETQVKQKVNFVFLDDEDEDEDDVVNNTEISDINNFGFNDNDDFESEEPATKKGRGRPKGTKKISTTEQIQKKGRGRPKGTKKNQNDISNNSSEPKKGRGRPKKVISNIEDNKASTPAVKEIKRGRGRPRKDSILGQPVSVICNKPMKGRGRPKGSTKKQTIAPADEISVKKRGRGRPKGSSKQNKEIIVPVNLQKVLGRKRGRPKKLNP